MHSRAITSIKFQCMPLAACYEQRLMHPFPQHLPPGKLTKTRPQHAPATQPLPLDAHAKSMRTRQGHDVAHVRHQLLLQAPVQDLGTLHGLSHVEAGDVPAAKHNVVGINLEG